PIHALSYLFFLGGRVSLGRNKAAIPVVVVAVFVGGAAAETIGPALAATADDLVIGGEACSSRWDANCDGDTTDEILFWLVFWGWKAIRLYWCLRSLWAAAVWLTGTAFFIDARRRASSFLLRWGVGGPAAPGEARVPQLGGPVGGGGGGGVAAAPAMRTLEEEQDVELAVIPPRPVVEASAAVGQHPLPLPP
ncbi:unnamed protein product, partial [Ectocarpus fasciculatus]